MLLTHRHRVYELSPPWLRRLNAFRLLYACALILDVLADALMLAIKVRFLNYVTEIGLARTSFERRIVRGPNESADSFSARLAQWWDVGKRAGSFLVLAEQLQAYFLPERPQIWLVRNDGKSFRLDPDGTRLYTDFPGWLWDNRVYYHSRFWVLIRAEAFGLTPHTRVVGQPGNTVRQEGMSVGSVTPVLNPAVSTTSAAVDLRRILELWRPPHTRCDGFLVYYSFSTPMAGDWDRWENRPTSILYWRGTE